jgi:hypothetical protein
MNKPKTFESVYLEIDKMAGLRAALHEKQYADTVLSIQDWDQSTPYEVRGRLIDGEYQTVWEGTLVTAEQIAQVFEPFDENGSRRTYARRNGRPGHPKTAGIIRVETRDAINFELVLSDGGGQPMNTLTTIESPKRLTLEVQVKGTTISKVLFDIETHRKKIDRLLGR